MVYSYIDAIPKVPRKNKSSTGISESYKKKNKIKTPKHGGIQRYYTLCNNYGIPKLMYMSHSFENYFGKSSDQ